MNTLKTAIKLSRQYNRFFCNNLYEPDYLKLLKPKIPIYDCINIQIRGYDYPVLENFQKYIHTLADNMELNVEDCWALPPQHMQISTYKPLSEIITSQYNLKLHQRTVQVTDISSIQLPILLKAVEASLPAGITLEAVVHEEYHEEDRYIPDKDLLTLKQELDEMGGPRKVK